MKRYKIAISIIILFCLSCNEDPSSPNTPPTENTTYENLVFSDKVELFNYPSFGSTNTNFEFKVVLRDPTLRVSKIKYDFTSDNNYDTLLTAQDTVKSKFSLFGYNTVIGSVVLADETVLSCSTIIWVTDPQLIAADGSVFYEPNIYNGNMISVTHGRRHQVQFVDQNSFAMECFFCDFESEKFSEMHISIPSFDGKNLLFDNGTDYLFCVYDLAKNDSTTIDLPINLVSYPVGKLTWSLDNESIYCVSVDKNYTPSGIKSYNLQTKQIVDLYEKGDYVCIVPDQPDKIAILEEVNNSESKLIIFNTSSNSVEAEYSEIPFNAPFRILRDNDRIYFDGEMAFYSLSRKKSYFMAFDELDLSEHMYGEADINMDGNKFIIGTWIDFRGLYEITLPNQF
ncbi:MAG: hypothetical protein K9G44_09435 [Melioribacteraceae bacterium]|nr:hypothetical protein [Melioribacteraceae bacterium]